MLTTEMLNAENPSQLSVRNSSELNLFNICVIGLSEDSGLLASLFEIVEKTIIGMIPARFNFRILLTCSVFKVAENSIGSPLEQAVDWQLHINEGKIVRELV
jgi:hypothetical protein